MFHFIVGLVFISLVSEGLAAYTGFRGFWFWFVLLQAVFLVQTIWGWLYGWFIWKTRRKKVIAEFVFAFKAIDFPAFTDYDLIGPMLYLEQVANSSDQTTEVRQLAHQIIIIVRTLNDLRKTTERKRYLDAVEEALLQISS
jgi:hypothetical protein